MEGEPKEQAEPANDRSYAEYHESGKLSFDPHDDLNLPRNYDEVLSRFNKLQGERAMEALN